MSLMAHLDVQHAEFRLRADLECPSTGFTAVFGPSGCGKTTLLRSVAGLERHPKNQLRMNDVTWQDATTWVPPHRRKVGLIFQKPALFENRTVVDNLQYGWRRTPEEQRRFHLEDIIERLELSSYLKRRAGSLSGGEGQRVAIGRALLASPSLLLMDEPLSALDEEAKEKIFPFLEQLRSLKIPVLMVTHSLEEVARLADHVVLLRQGSLVQSGSASEVLSDPENGLATHEHAQCALDGKVKGFEGSCSLIETDAGLWRVPSNNPKAGSQVRLQIRARDVSVAKYRHSDTSIRNLLDATLIDITPCAGDQTLLRLQVGNAVLLSLVTRDAVEDLQLQPGMKLVAQIKSLSLGYPTSA